MDSSSAIDGEVGGGADGVTDAVDPPGQADHVAAPDAGALVAGQPAREADVALGRPRGIHRHRHLDPVAAVEQLGHRLGRRRAQPHVPRPRADGDDDVLERRGAQDPHGAGDGLLDRLEQGVGGALGEPVGVLDDDDPPRTHRRPQGRHRSQLASLLDLDRKSFGGNDIHVGVGAVHAPCGTRGTRRSRAAGTRSAAANARAATDRPDPGGPVSSHAWVIAVVSVTARCRVATAVSCPMTSRHTVTAGPPCVRSRLEHLGVDRVGGERAVDHEVALRVALGHREVVRADRVVEGVLLGLEPVVDVAAPAPALLRRDVDDDGQVGHQVVDRPHVEVVDLLGAEVAPRALVGHRRVGVAVGQHHLAAVERRPDQLVDVVGLVGGEQQRLGARRDVVAVQHEVADLAPEVGAPGLAGDRHRASGGLEGLAEQAPPGWTCPRRRRPRRR